MYQPFGKQNEEGKNLELGGQRGDERMGWEKQEQNILYKIFKRNLKRVFSSNKSSELVSGENGEKQSTFDAAET